jgi:uncharacterized protein
MLGAALAVFAVLAAAPIPSSAPSPAPSSPSSSASPAAAVIPPAPVRWVEDHAGLMSSAARAALDARVEAYEHATGHQVVVWIGKTLQGAPLDDWAVRTFAAWKLGRKGIDDGVAIFVLADDRAIDIEVGYGLEDKVPDATASRIIREIMAPRLRAGDADGAVTAGADAVLTAIEGRPWQGGQGGPASPRDTTPSLLTLLIGGAVGVVVLILLVTHPQLALWLLWSIIASGRRGGGGFGGGGGSGGFGGGGGRSGGGGARGGW